MTLTNNGKDFLDACSLQTFGYAEIAEYGVTDSDLKVLIDNDLLQDNNDNTFTWID